MTFSPSNQACTAADIPAPGCGPTLQIPCPVHGQPNIGAPTRLAQECCCGCFDLVIDPDTDDLSVANPIQHFALVGLAIRGKARDGDLANIRCRDDGGWFADSFRAEQDGSRLWTLEAARVSEETRLQAIQMIEEALAFMVTDGYVARIVPNVVLDVSKAEIRIEHLDLHRPTDQQISELDLRCLWP